MFSLIWTNMKVNFIFYRRNRLLLAASVFIIFALGLSMVPALFFYSKAKHLDIIAMIFSQLSDFTFILAAGLGLLLISHHIRNRTLKMVFTKPCTPEIWLASSLASAVFVCLALYSAILVICSLLFAVWGIPFQWGILYVVFNDFFRTVILLSYISFLAVVFHPVVAVLFVIIFHERTFYYFTVLLTGGIKASGKSSLVPFLKILRGLFDSVYMVLPTFSPFGEKTGKIYSSLRLSDAGPQFLLMTLGYTLTSLALFYLLSVFFLRRKRLV